MRARRLVLLATLAPAACGYGLVRPGAVAARPGVVDDLSTQGDLGVVVQRRLGLVLPRAVPDDAPRLDGTVRALDDRPIGFDASGFAALYEQPVEVELRATDADGRVTWTSGPHRRRAVFARGATPLETETARRAALADAARLATDDALATAPERTP
jgi:hypothetical protein